ncbi:hypothetical protein CAI21_09975 [Alkalilimnicola ehrlichii]|uniref:Na+/H+ antiporter subunit C n=1 Tax=Alkalilimnicola ehrlichii TaxID=351052 RepID=A0A3E0WY26_9GAMM|nr:cation:proton antiporter subunit C [Alkalilimnicola ehrlichii]RFA29383.1 hypothetical protein CAI21_09975 [Alkalilimnicola ehrlichii]RFA36895.1 hypothetical protein CAL65_10305 [Alkalilimnicola ehrlichii]
MMYMVLAGALFGIGLSGLFSARHPLRKVLSLNVLSASVFLLLVAVARQSEPLDAVPHAIVLTGIVVTVSTTAVALALLVRLPIRGRQDAAGRPKERP